MSTVVIGFVVDGVAELMVGGGSVASGLFVWCVLYRLKRFPGTKPKKIGLFVPFKTFSRDKTESAPVTNPSIWLRNSEKGRKFTWLKESKILCQING